MMIAQQPPDTATPHIDTDILQFFGRALPAPGRAAAKSPRPTWADVHHRTQRIRWERPNMFLEEPEPHGSWLMKNWVAFFRISRSSRRMRFSRRSRSFSSASARSSGDTTSVPRCAVIQLCSADTPTPGSSAICLRESLLVSAIRTTFSRNSSVLTASIAHLLCCTFRYQRSVTKPQQDQRFILPISPSPSVSGSKIGRASCRERVYCVV